MSVPTDMKMEYSVPLLARKPVQLYRGGCGQSCASLLIQRSRHGLRLSPCGDWSAELFLEELPKKMNTASQGDYLEINLEETSQFDQISLTAMLVILRCHADQFKSIALDGLPHWAAFRIKRTDPNKLLGAKWDVTLKEKSVIFSDNNAVKRREGAENV